MAQNSLFKSYETPQTFDSDPTNLRKWRNPKRAAPREWADAPRVDSRAAGWRPAEGPLPGTCSRLCGGLSLKPVAGLPELQVLEEQGPRAAPTCPPEPQLQRRDEACVRMAGGPGTGEGRGLAVPPRWALQELPGLRPCCGPGKPLHSHS